MLSLNLKTSIQANPRTCNAGGHYILSKPFSGAAAPLFSCKFTKLYEKSIYYYAVPCYTIIINQVTESVIRK